MGNSPMFKSMLTTSIFAMLLGSSAIAQTKDAAVCNVADFKMLALATNDEQAREKSVTDWLVKFGKVCAADQIVFIRANLAPWLGTSNTMKVNQSTDPLLAEKRVTQKNYDADTSEVDKNKNNTTPNKPQTETMSTRR